MKILKIIFPLVTFILISCQDLVIPELSSDNTMTSVKCIVVTQEKMNDTGSKPEDEKLELTGSISDNGYITFSGLSVLTDDQKKQARFEATIPYTATIVEKDGAGKVIGTTIGGLRSITKATYYFYVIAADGSEKKYVMVFN